METKKRKLAKIRPVKFEMPKRKFDIMETIRDVYNRVKVYLNTNKQNTVTFSQLLPSKAQKRDKVYTFIPLLHLENQRKINTKQDKPFGEIFVKLLKKKNGHTK